MGRLPMARQVQALPQGKLYKSIRYEDKFYQIYSPQEYRDVASKYAENCSAKDMKGTAAMMYLSLGDIARDNMLSFMNMLSFLRNSRTLPNCLLN